MVQVSIGASCACGTMRVGGAGDSVNAEDEMQRDIVDSPSCSIVSVSGIALIEGCAATAGRNGL